MKLKFTLFLFIAFYSLNLLSQSISKSLISSNGSLGSTVSRTNFSIGEPVIGLMKSSDIQLSNGYYQSLNISTLSIENPFITHFEYYPNPVQSFLKFEYESNTLFDVKVFDINGRLIKSKTLKEGQLYMGDLIQGVYILSLSNRETNFYKSIKIIKK